MAAVVIVIYPRCGRGTTQISTTQLMTWVLRIFFTIVYHNSNGVSTRVINVHDVASFVPSRRKVKPLEWMTFLWKPLRMMDFVFIYISYFI